MSRPAWLVAHTSGSVSMQVSKCLSLHRPYFCLLMFHHIIPNPHLGSSLSSFLSSRSTSVCFKTTLLKYE